MCGFIGLYGPDGTDVAAEIYEGLLAIQHRGQDAAGIITFTDRFHLHKDFGLVLQVFGPTEMQRLRGPLGLGHVRYPTVGDGDVTDAQPFHLTFPLGIAMAHNGNVTNAAEIIERYFRKSGTRLNSSCDLELILMVFARGLDERLEPGRPITPADIFHAVKVVFDEVKGAYSVVAALPDAGLVAFRDPYGIKPICVGKKDLPEGPSYAVVSESVVLDVNGYERQRDLGPGEVLFVDTARKVHIEAVMPRPHHPCIFEWVYFARPDSFLDDVSVYKTRQRFGRALAEQWRAANAPRPDVVIPIPDSSRDAAFELARELGIPCREGLVKNRYIGRTFIMPSQSSRATSIRRKLNPIRLEFEGKDVLLVDDSVVRGNTSRRIVQMARDAGARRVYMAVTSPPLVAPCPYGIDMASKREFVATGRTVEEVATLLGLDYLMYLDREAMNECARAGNPNLKQFCNACMTGSYPTPDITRESLRLIEAERAENTERALVNP